MLIEVINYRRILQLISRISVTFGALYDTICLISVRSTATLFRRRIISIRTKKGNIPFKKRSLTLYSKHPIQSLSRLRESTRPGLFLYQIEIHRAIAGKHFRSEDSVYGVEKVLRSQNRRILIQGGRFWLKSSILMLLRVQ